MYAAVPPPGEPGESETCSTEDLRETTGQGEEDDGKPANIPEDQWKVPVICTCAPTTLDQLAHT